MNQEHDIPLADWAQPGEPFRLLAVDINAADWSRWLTPEALARAARFSDPRAWARAGASEWFKGCWLPRELGLEGVEWKMGMHGKPRPAGAAAGWGFNLSHAGDYVVAALMKNAAVGVDLALAQGLPALVSVLMGVVTATFGGVLRDILCNEIPHALNDHQPYAAWSFLGGWAYVESLDLIARLCEHLGWQLDLDADPEGGTVARLRFRPVA